MPERPPGDGRQLERLIREACARLGEANRAREVALPACRRAIRSAGSSVRAVHRVDPAAARALADDAEKALREAQEALRPYPAVGYAGFLHDAEKEYAECILTGALIDGGELPGPDQLRVGVPAWLNGLAEAASEMRRHLLDRLREGDLENAEGLLRAMDEVYDRLMTVDFPDAVTAGLRRTTDGLRAVLERSRSDLTTTALQWRLQQAVERGLPPRES